MKDGQLICGGGMLKGTVYVRETSRLKDMETLRPRDL